VDDVIFAQEETMRNKCILKVATHRGQHGFDTAAYSLTDPPGGSTGPGAESDISVSSFVYAIRSPVRTNSAIAS